MDKKGKLLFHRFGLFVWVSLALVAVLFVLKEWLIGILCGVLWIILFIYNLLAEGKRSRDIQKYIESIAFNLDTAAKDTLLNFPLPLLLLEIDGSVMWYNSSYKSSFSSTSMLSSNQKKLMEQFGINPLTSQENTFYTEMSLDRRHFDVRGSYIKVKEEKESKDYVIMLFFIETTDKWDIKIKYEEEKTCVGIIIIDNYDDLMQSMPDYNRSQMLAEIDKRVTDWTAFTGGVAKKYERDKYLFIFANKYLQVFEDKKYDLLENVKEINVENKIPVTLSMGFGINGENILENFHFAVSSIDIALGRGGDHAVIRNGSKVTFYGGHNKELEKRTKVKARMISFALRDIIEKSDTVFIMGHQFIDFDCVGSALGVFRMAACKGKKAYIIEDEYNPTVENLLNKIKSDSNYENVFLKRYEVNDYITEKSLVVLVDTHRPNYSQYPELLKKVNQVVIIDHHRRGADYMQDALLIYQEIYASSASELVTELLQYFDDKITLLPIEAEALYTGILVDTKNFIVRTGVRTFEAAAYLKKFDINAAMARNYLLQDKETYIIVSEIIKNAEYIKNGIYVSVCPPDSENQNTIVAQAADQLMSLQDVKASFVIGRLNDEIFISGRSFGEVNVQMILERLGGGGHSTSAGVQLKGVSRMQAKDKLIKEINDIV